jgi:signal transduction histidine kinase
MHSEAMTKEQADICALAKTTVELLRFKASEKNQTINLTIPQMPLILTINKEKIARVINNLVTNAIKFSKSGADIHVKLDIDSDGTRLSVADNGIGIPDDLKNKIFDLFTEAKRYGTSGEQPYGLGLSISRQIVEAHNGRIWFESIVGNGTTFYVYVPTTFVA